MSTPGACLSKRSPAPPPRSAPRRTCAARWRRSRVRPPRRAAQTWRSCASSTAPATSSRGRSRPQSSSLGAEVAGTRVACDVLAAGTVSEPLQRAAARVHAAGTAALVARGAGDRVLGSLELVRVSEPFDDGELALAELAASQLALAIRMLGPETRSDLAGSRRHVARARRRCPRRRRRRRPDRPADRAGRGRGDRRAGRDALAHGGRRGRSSCSPRRVRKAVSKPLPGSFARSLGDLAAGRDRGAPGSPRRRDACSDGLARPARVRRPPALFPRRDDAARRTSCRRSPPSRPGRRTPCVRGNRRARSRRSSGGRARCSRWSARRSRASRSHTRSRPRWSASPSCSVSSASASICAKTGSCSPPRGAGCRPGTRRSPRGCSRSRSGRCALAPPSTRTSQTTSPRSPGRGRRSPLPGSARCSPCRCTCATTRSGCSSPTPARARSARATSRCSRRWPPSSRSPSRTRACTSGRRSSVRRSARCSRQSARRRGR